MSQTLTQPQLTPNGATAEALAPRWMVVIYDNDVTPVEVVIHTLMVATGCDLTEAQIETWEAQEFGKAPVHFATRDECEAAASVIQRIGVKAEVSPEWND